MNQNKRNPGTYMVKLKGRKNWIPLEWTGIRWKGYTLEGGDEIVEINELMLEEVFQKLEETMQKTTEVFDLISNILLTTLEKTNLILEIKQRKTRWKQVKGGYQEVEFISYDHDVSELKILNYNVNDALTKIQRFRKEGEF